MHAQDKVMINDFSKGRWLLVVVALSFALTGCNKPGSGDSDEGAGVIKVGEFASRTGTEAAFGQASHKGTELAIDEMNAKGGVLGKKLQLLTEDTQFRKPGESATVVKKLISRDNVIALLGEVASSRSLEAAPICQQNNIPMISPSSTNPKVTETGDYIFRVCFIDPFQGKLLSIFARKTSSFLRPCIAGGCWLEASSLWSCTDR